MDLDKILRDAKLTLEKNWNGRFTIPSPTLYPHQWSWDSGFIAIGNSYYHADRAIREIEFLFDAQWKNGMVPHIVFNEKEKTYFPSAGFYEIVRSDNAPTHIGTSGMTQPAVHAISCYYIYKNSEDKSKAKEFPPCNKPMYLKSKQLCNTNSFSYFSHHTLCLIIEFLLISFSSFNR